MAVIVPLEGERRSAAKPTLDAINALVAEDLKEVNALIIRRMESTVPLIPQIAGHIVAGGGKRIRPILTLATARLCGYDGKRQLALAACIETSRALLTEDEVARITQPTLIAVGTTDDIGGSAEALAALMPNAVAFAIEGRDHMLSVGDRTFKKRALEFLKAHPIAR